MIFESESSEQKKILKAKYPDRKIGSMTVAPDAVKRFFSGIYAMYMYQIDKGTATNDNHYSDVIVVGRPRDKTLPFYNFGHFDEFYQATSTYYVFLKDGKVSMLNAVSNDIENLDASVPSFDKKMKSIFYQMCTGLFRHKISLSGIIKVLEKYDEIVDGFSNWLIVKKNGKCGIINKDGTIVLNTAVRSIRRGPTDSLTVVFPMTPEDDENYYRLKQYDFNLILEKGYHTLIVQTFEEINYEYL
jgi:hypothetical protein